MKNVMRLALVAMAACVFYSCENLGLTAPAMDSEKAVNRIREAYEKNVVTDEYRPIELTWYETEKLSNELTHLLITSIGKADNKAYNQVIKVGGDYQNANDMEESRFNKSRTYEFDTLDWIELSDIDSDIILKQIEEAKNQIPEEYAYQSISTYTLKKDKETKKPISEFIIRVTEKGNSKSIENGSLVTTYYEISFVGMPDGTVIMEEE